MGDFSIRGLYHEFMKSGLRISIKDYNFKTSIAGGKAGRAGLNNYMFLK
jgi:hypothetical protein